MHIVADTSVLIALEQIGLLDLLPQLFGVVWIPPAVNQELHETSHHTERRKLLAQSWLQLHAVQPTPDTSPLNEVLDAGEREAIDLAEQLSATLLIDDWEGRQVANRRGIQITGTAGVLLTAKKAGLIPAVAPYLSRLRNDFGFRLGRKYLEIILKAAGEL